MEYNNEQNFQEQNSHEDAVILKEKKESSTAWVWYLILILLLLGLLGWFAFIKGFGTKKVDFSQIHLDDIDNPIDPEQIPSVVLDEANAPIDTIEVKTLEGFPVRKQLVVKGSLSNGCVYLNEPNILRSGNNFYVNLTTRQEGELCTEALVPYSKVIDVDVLGLPAGVYNISVNGRETQFEIEQDNKIDFSAGSEK